MLKCRVRYIVVSNYKTNNVRIYNTHHCHKPVTTLIPEIEQHLLFVVATLINMFIAQSERAIPGSPQLQYKTFNLQAYMDIFPSENATQERDLHNSQSSDHAAKLLLFFEPVENPNKYSNHPINSPTSVVLPGTNARGTIPLTCISGPYTCMFRPSSLATFLMFFKPSW